MPGKTKQVRFSHTNLLHSPPTPSPSYSITSLPSPRGPITPPDAFPSHHLGLPGPSPYKYALPERSSRASTSPLHSPLSIHPALASSHSPLLKWDLTFPPSAAGSLTGRPIIPSDRATSVPLSSITILLPHIRWPIKVYASYRGGAITITDILNAIYDTLRENVASSDYHALPRQEQKRVTASYENRYRRIKSNRGYAEEKSQGVKKVDFLMGKTRFMGLSTSGSRPDHWVLHTS
ncbi:hypothetical protein HGRIS_012854 [Hohenbuehelia grisea]|uniref:DUF6699 domain-containing protein n=1 Tax=Hohenbuehelia grisea TaxID=104357 RepID=A0ABR3ITS2_9AGAR